MSVDRSPSSLVFDFLVDTIEGVTDEEDPLYEAEILDSKSQKMTKDRGLVVSNASYELAPRQEMEIDAFDAVVIIAFWSRVLGKEATQRQTARDEVYRMANYVAQKIFEDMSLGSRVCNSLLERATDGSRSVTSTEYAVINLPIILNPTGEAVSYNFGEPTP